MRGSGRSLTRSAGAESFSAETLDAVARRFRLLGEPVRLRLLQTLEAGERAVNDLTEVALTSQANVSRHLTSMYEAGILNRRRDGTCVYYSIADPMVFRLCEIVCESERKRIRNKLNALGKPRGKRSSYSMAEPK